MLGNVSDDLERTNQKIFQYHQVIQKREQIKIRELDKKYTHANHKRGKCTVKHCTNNATHWLTRQNSEYCRSDMVCNLHAAIWMEVKSLIAHN